MSSVFERVRHVFIDHLGVHEDQVQETTTFDELGVDSLDQVELVIRIEDEFAGDRPGDGAQLEISDDEAKSIRTIHDIVQYLKSRGIEDR
jgi:acyl carrier protein